MKEITQKWLPYSKADLVSAKVLLSKKNINQWTKLLSLYHCQQAIEKILKAIMIEDNKEIFKVHDLLRLIKLADVGLSQKQQEFILSLNSYYLISRYPDLQGRPLENPRLSLVKDFLRSTEELYLFLEKKLKKK